jgi:hypothetical protein
MMEQKRLTKSQRRRANERARKAQDRWWDENMGPAPPLDDELGRNIDETPEVWQRAPAHVVDTENLAVDRSAMAQLSRQGNASKASESEARASELKLRYPNHWGRRGGAGFIARKENDAGNPISERTVRNYFKLKK